MKRKKEWKASMIAHINAIEISFKNCVSWLLLYYLYRKKRTIFVNSYWQVKGLKIIDTCNLVNHEETVNNFTRDLYRPDTNDLFSHVFLLCPSCSYLVYITSLSSENCSGLGYKLTNVWNRSIYLVFHGFFSFRKGEMCLNQKFSPHFKQKHLKTIHKNKFFYKKFKLLLSKIVSQKNSY